MDRTRKYILIFLLITSYISYGQKNIKNDESLNFSNLKDSVSKYKENEIDKAISYANLYINLAKNGKSKIQEFKGLLLIFKVYEKSNYNQANNQIKILEEFAKKHYLKRELIKTYDRKISLLYDKDVKLNTISVNKILNHYNLAIATSQEINDYSLELDLTIRRNMLEMRGENYMNALKNFENLTEEIKKRKFSNNFNEEDKLIYLGWVYHNIIKNYIFLKNVKSASKYNESLHHNYFHNRDSTFKRINSEERFMHFYNKNKAEIYFLKNKYDSAQYYFNESIKVKISNHNFFSDSIRFLGKVAFKKKEFLKAIDYFKPYEKHIDTIYSDYHESFIDGYYKYIGLSYKEIGNYKKANLFLERHMKSVSSNNKYKDSINLSIKELEIHQIEKEIANIKILEKTRKKYIIVLIITLILTVSGFLFYYCVNKKKNKRNFDALMLEIENSKNNIPSPNKALKSKTKIQDSKIQVIIKNLELLEQKRYYLSMECSLSSVAKKINTNTSYLSKIINSHYEKNFNAYINELRIDYVLQRLKTDRLFRRYSIQSIANDIGFKSKESFNKAFRNQTGILPSFFIKQLELKHDY